jgi:hypothetical protein
MMRCGWITLLLLVLAGCGTTGKIVRLKMGHEASTVFTSQNSGEQVELEKREFEAALLELVQDVRPSAHPLREARQRFGIPERSRMYWYEGHGRRLLPVGDDENGRRLLEPSLDDELTRAYGRWCERRRQSGDCLRLLEEGPLLGSDGKYVLAMAIAMGSVWQETVIALENTAEPHVLIGVTSSCPWLASNLLACSREGERHGFKTDWVACGGQPLGAGCRGCAGSARL